MSRKEPTIDPVSFFHLQHGRVHSSKVSSVASLADRIFGALTDEQTRVRPGTGLNSPVWLLWHMARVEDVAVNLAVTAGRQVLDDGWSSRLGVLRTDAGHGMTEDEVAEFTERADITAVRAYRDAVGLRTRAVVAALGPAGGSDVLPGTHGGVCLHEGAGHLVRQDRSQAPDQFGARRSEAGAHRESSQEGARAHGYRARFPKAGRARGSTPRIKDNPPLIFHPPWIKEAEASGALKEAWARYHDSLPEHVRVLFDRFHLCDTAVKVVGVGSVGTACGIALFMAADDDPLFLQIKQANASVLEPYAGKSRHENHGQRVVVGQRLMQSASDMFLGWAQGHLGRHFYVRQLRDMKISADIDGMDDEMLRRYAGTCGWALARAHARSGDAAMIAGYMGSGPSLDEAVCDFAGDYADQAERDHKAFVKTFREGRVKAVVEG